ncbi:hypothetical protein A6U85_26070 [Agrobacterium sp. 13-626]|nr:hypothetical protein DXT98_28625 [Agrobacterium sp. ICMP 7243]KEA03188.1 hypothetical protein CN09_32780 [Rhizobium rhizogenes]MQB34509.1 hypothetical protein [Rhizobium rhizogenes]OCJ04865.1 hypothetical protein A6U85_26070 [Agrobacterium sp. 13-626]OCJ28971.1 hypothetical protein A6U89_27180 [Agrobacterium sp. B133/95]
MIERAIDDNGTIFRCHGERVAVILPCDKSQEMKTLPSFGWLLANAPLEDDDLSVRKPARPQLPAF